MKNLLYLFVAIALLSACSEKSDKEKLSEEVNKFAKDSEKTFDKAADKTGEAAKDAAEETEKNSSKILKRLKKEL